MTFSEAIGVESPTLFGLYFIFGCIWALITGCLAIAIHLIEDDEPDAARIPARLFFQTPIWPVVAALWAFRGLMVLRELAYGDRQEKP